MNKTSITSTLLSLIVLLAFGCKDKSSSPSPIQPSQTEKKMCRVDGVKIITPSSEESITYYWNAANQLDSFTDKNQAYHFTYEANKVTAIQYRLPNRTNRIKYELLLHADSTPKEMITYSSSRNTFSPIFKDVYVCSNGKIIRVDQNEWKSSLNDYQASGARTYGYGADGNINTMDYYYLDSDGERVEFATLNLSGWDGKTNPYKGRYESLMIYNSNTLWDNWAYWTDSNVGQANDGFNNNQYAYTYTSDDYPATVSPNSYTTHQYEYTCKP